jgi:hypothetical protein
MMDALWCYKEADDSTKNKKSSAMNKKSSAIIITS